MKRLILLLIFSVTFNFAQETEKKLSVFKVENGQLKDNTFLAKGFKDNKRVKTLWTQFYNLFPKAIINKHIVSFEVMTDGLDQNLAALQPVDFTNKQWKLIIDIKDAENNKSKDHLHTLIHEFGHLITLNNTQVTPTEDIYQEGDLYLTEEGYAKSNSYLDQYVNTYWVGPILDKWDKIAAVKNENKKAKKLYKLFSKNDTLFVTDYAAESPEEDIAESWTFFVLNKANTNSDLIKNQKINFFNQFAELVVIKDYILKQL